MLLLLLFLMATPGANIFHPALARVWCDVVLLGNFADTNLVGSVCYPLLFVCLFGGRVFAVGTDGVEMAVYDILCFKSELSLLAATLFFTCHF